LLLRNDGGATTPYDGAFQERIAAMKTKFHDDMTMDAIMREWPDTIRVVLDHGLLCVGCPIASFHTPVDVAKEHQVDETRLIHDLVGAMKG
jgi:hybrid cluster-associated redox disulfide protein